LQFSSVDEYRYHEALVHPVMSAAGNAKNVLVLGGGDGLAVREILKYPSVESVTLVDIDPAMTRLAKEFNLLADLNERSLSDSRVTVVNQDAFIWAGKGKEKFDVVVIDFPDPGSYSVGKLYTTRFYRLLRERLTEDARLSIQCTSPLVAPNSYWCILNTLRETGFDVRPYCTSVPTFGIWGFAYATVQPGTNEPIELAKLDGELRFLTPSTMQAMFDLPSDIRPTETELNELNNQILVRYYDQEWSGQE
jgi:spermidine synthase